MPISPAMAGRFLADYGNWGDGNRGDGNRGVGSFFGDGA